MSKNGEKGRAFHLAQWIRGELGKQNDSLSWSEPEIETWTEEMLKERTDRLDINLNYEDNKSAVTKLEIGAEKSSRFSAKNENVNLQLMSPVSYLMWVFFFPTLRIFNDIHGCNIIFALDHLPTRNNGKEVCPK